MTTAPASGFYYGWAIVGITFSTQFLMTGCVFYGFSVVLTSLADEFAGGDRTPIIAVQAIGGVAGMVCAPVVWRLMGRGHERGLITAGALAAGLALLGASRATALWQIAALFGTLIGLASHTLSATGPSTLVVHRGLRIHESWCGNITFRGDSSLRSCPCNRELYHQYTG